MINNVNTNLLQAEIKRLNTENTQLKTELEMDKDKLHTLEGAFENMRKQGTHTKIVVVYKRFDEDNITHRPGYSYNRPFLVHCFNAFKFIFNEF